MSQKPSFLPNPTDALYHLLTTILQRLRIRILIYLIYSELVIESLHKSGMYNTPSDEPIALEGKQFIYSSFSEKSNQNETMVRLRIIQNRERVYE